MNTYIQDKLDEFDKFAKEDYEDGGFSFPFEGLDDIRVDDIRVREWIEQSFTDYHNHIVEIAVNDFGKLMNKLQDTNPKE